MNQSKREIKGSYFYYVNSRGGLISVRKSSKIQTITQGLIKAKELITEGRS